MKKIGGCNRSSMTHVKTIRYQFQNKVDSNITFGFGNLFLWLIKPSNIPIFGGEINFNMH